MGDDWFEGYQDQTTDELLALEGRYRIDSLVVAFEEALQRKAEPLSRLDQGASRRRPHRARVARGVSPPQPAALRGGIGRTFQRM